MMRLRGLQARFLAAQLVVVVVAVVAMALVAHWSISQQVQEYTDRNQAVLAELRYRLERERPNVVGVQPPDVQSLPPLPPPLSVAATEGAEVLDASVNRSLLVAGSIGVFSAVILTILISRRIVYPLRRLTAAAQRLERGQPHEGVSIESNDELGQLSRAFNSMAESLARTERLRRMMVSDVAHELRTPLSNVCGYLEAMVDGVIPISRASITSLHDEAMSLAQVVDDLRDLALADAGQLRLDWQAVDVEELLLASANAIRPVAIRRQLGVEVERVARPIHVIGDQKRLRQVVRNLLLNALAHTPAGGSIHLAVVAADSQWVRISIRDTGGGIPAEHLPYVFERFYRVDAARTRTAGSTGLGLAIVKQLVEAQGGQVALTSEVGHGTTVMLSLRVAELSSASQAPDECLFGAEQTTQPVRLETRG